MQYSADNDVPPTSIQSLLEGIGQQVEMYRISRQIRQADLAKQAGISTRTLVRLENGKNSSIETLIRILRALDIEDRLSLLIPDASQSPLQIRDNGGKRRQRVRAPKAPTPVPWQWGEEDEA